MFRVFRYKFVVNLEQVFLQRTEYSTYIRLGNWATFGPLRRVMFNSRDVMLRQDTVITQNNNWYIVVLS